MGEGFRSGLLLGVCVVLLAIVGLDPAFTGVPEIPLVAVALVLPTAVLLATGFHAVRRSTGIGAGALAAAIAGAISGGIGGLSYVAFGKSLLNIPIGLAVGAIAGAIAGAAGALIAQRRVERG